MPTPRRSPKPKTSPASPTSPTTPRRHRGNNGIRRHPKRTKALALADRTSTKDAALIAGVPLRTIQHWRQYFSLQQDSELEAFIAQAKREMGATWAVLGAEGQEFALELRRDGDAKGFLSAMTGAGIAATKLELLGQPRVVVQEGSNAPPPPSNPDAE